MNKVTLLPHTADIRMKVEASSLELLFTTAVEAMNEILKKGICEDVLEFPLKEILDIQSLDTTTLLIDFLSDVLTMNYQHQAIFCKAEIHKLHNNILSATLCGVPVDGYEEDIKAVTYHEAEVIRNQKGNWESIVIFDI